LNGPWLKKVEITEAPQNRRFYAKMKCIPLWPTYIGEKGRTLGKTYGIKARCYWLHPWGNIGILGNPLGTCSEQMKKEKNQGTLIACMKFLFPKLLVTIFGLG